MPIAWGLDSHNEIEPYCSLCIIHALPYDCGSCAIQSLFRARATTALFTHFISIFFLCYIFKHSFIRLSSQSEKKKKNRKQKEITNQNENMATLQFHHYEMCTTCLLLCFLTPSASSPQFSHHDSTSSPRCWYKPYRHMKTWGNKSIHEAFSQH